MTAAPTTEPITIPAMAPSDNDELDLLFSSIIVVPEDELLTGEAEDELPTGTPEDEDEEEGTTAGDDDDDDDDLPVLEDGGGARELDEPSPVDEDRGAVENGSVLPRSQRP